MAMQEAAKRTGEHGLFVVADIANLPFKEEVFDGVVSLHTIHHVPGPEKGQAYRELYRVMKPERSGVVVNGWTVSPMMVHSQWLVRLMERIGGKNCRDAGQCSQTGEEIAGREERHRKAGSQTYGYIYSEAGPCLVGEGIAGHPLRDFRVALGECTLDEGNYSQTVGGTFSIEGVVLERRNHAAFLWPPRAVSAGGDPQGQINLARWR